MAGSPLPSAGAERRQLTLLFCDLVNYSRIASLLDPEDLHDLIEAYRQYCIDRCAMRSGIVSAFSGDGILVIFGYPEAHEDDAERAVRAALELIDGLPELRQKWAPGSSVPLSIRVGIATGLCVVDATPSAVGECVNLAARLQAAAEPDTILISAATNRLLGELFDCQGPLQLSVKGFSSPVLAWSVRAARGLPSRFEGVRGGHHTPFVGRHEELRQLLDGWNSAGNGIGTVCRIYGEPGIGKSRLIHELRQRVDPESTHTLFYQCLPLHQNSALFPLIAQLDYVARINDCDDPLSRFEYLEKVLVGSPEEVRGQIALVAPLLSMATPEAYPMIQLSPLERRRQTMEVLCAQLLRRAELRPVLVIVEDAQWLDPTSKELLDLVIRRISAARVLVVVAARPAASSTDDDAASRPIRLAGLNRSDSRTMLTALTEGRPMPEALREYILSRTDGVPLFIEETTQAVLISEPAMTVSEPRAVAAPIEAAIPMTLQDSLVARLDAMGSAKGVAQFASVIGREFTLEALSSVAGLSPEQLATGLDQLVASGLILQHRDTYAFKHALIQDAAYQSLLRSRRRELHGRIAVALEAESTRQGAGHLELLAHHYVMAGIDAKALPFQLLAGRHALERSANIEAREHFTHALAAIKRLSDEKFATNELECLIGLGAARRAVEGFASQGVEESFGRARDLCLRGIGTTAQLMDALRGLFACFYTRSDFRKAREQGEQVLERAGENPYYLTMGNWMLGCVMFWQGEFGEARRRLENALTFFDPAARTRQTLDAQIDLEANAKLHLAWTLWFLGYADQAHTRAAEAIALSRQLRQPFALAMALFWASAPRVCCGHHEAAATLIAELRAVTTEYHIAYLGAACTVLEAHVTVLKGNIAEGIQQIRTALEEFRRQRAGLGWPFAMSLPASACAQAGQVEEGLAMIAEAFEAANQHGDAFWNSELHRLKGDLLLVQSPQNYEQAEECYLQAANVAVAQGARFLELRAVTSLVRLQQQIGDDSDAARLQSLYEWFTEGHDTQDYRNAAATLQAVGREVVPAAGIEPATP
jgi:class 3 adenylate cyclase/tetratricopeptide (TPR) repeat protein